MPKPEPGDFDLYVLAQSWAPLFCCQKADRCTTVSWAFSARHLSLHGLWPAYSAPRPDGSKRGAPSPLSCDDRSALAASQLPREYVDLAPSFTKWNPAAHRAEVGDLAKHEWKKHGTCSGLGPDAYFAAALEAMKRLPGDRGTPPAITAHVGGQVDAAQLRAQYSRRVAVRGDGACRLSEVTSCWAKGPGGAVGPQVDCPAHVMAGRDSPRCSTFLINALGECLLADGGKGGGGRQQRGG
eukprot:scaffold8866_cov96-Isochrysis_galbana.AAC.2